MVNARASKVYDDDETTQDSPPKPKKRRAKLRSRKTKEHVMDKINMYLHDSSSEEDDGTRKFNLNEKLTCERYAPENNPSIIIEKQASEITLEYFQRNDFETPILIKENTNNGLGLKMPQSNFWVDDVKDLVGPRRMLDVMNVETQEAETMKMKDWATYFKKTERDRLLNVISLEFSHTKLDNLVDSPRFVKKMDWVDLVWPRHLKKQQKEGTNSLQEMKYPKVQKYCLMSVGNCYTDFHIDFGGTSVWYHILRGGKVFWLIPPTEKNLKLYEEWTLSGKQGHIFFGDTVEECVRVNLKSGNTFLIPTGWIHAVYTTEDSLVFGGNFLHSFGIEKQLRCTEVENVTKVGQKFRYPFFNQLMWYVVIRYVHCLTGKNYLCVDDDGKSLLPEDKENGSNNDSKKNDETELKTEPEEKVEPIKNSYDTETEDEEEDKIVEMQRKYEEAEIKRKMKIKADRSRYPSKPFISFTPNSHIHLCQKELRGLNSLINWLEKLPPTKKCIPELLISPESLLRDARQLLEDHKNDDQNLAMTNETCLFWITKDFLKSVSNKPKRTYVKRAKPALVETNEIVSESPSVSFSNLSASVMSQDSANNHKLSSGTTLKKEFIPKGLQSLIAATDVNNIASTSSAPSPIATVQVPRMVTQMSLVRPIAIPVPVAQPVQISHYPTHYGSQTLNHTQVNSNNQYMTNGHTVPAPTMAPYPQVRHHVVQPVIAQQTHQVHHNNVHQQPTMVVQQAVRPIFAQRIVASAPSTSIPVVQVPHSAPGHVQIAPNPSAVAAQNSNSYYRPQYVNYQQPTAYAPHPNGHSNYYQQAPPPVQQQQQPSPQPQVAPAQPQYSYAVQPAPAPVRAYSAYPSQPQSNQYQSSGYYYAPHQQQTPHYPQPAQQYSVSNGQVPIAPQPPPQPPQSQHVAHSQAQPQQQHQQHPIIVHQTHQQTVQPSPMYQYNPTTYNYHY